MAPLKTARDNIPNTEIVVDNNSERLCLFTPTKRLLRPSPTSSLYTVRSVVVFDPLKNGARTTLAQINIWKFARTREESYLYIDDAQGVGVEVQI